MPHYARPPSYAQNVHPPSAETHAGWSHLIWHYVVAVRDNWIKICNLAYIETNNRRVKFGLKISNRLEKISELKVLRKHRPPPDASSSRIRIVIRNGLPDPDSDADRHQNVISWSLGHTPAFHKISSKSVVGNFFDNPVNPDFGLRTPGSGRWSGSSRKLNPLVPGPCLTPLRNFVKIRWQLFQLFDGQTDRQTNRPH